MVTASTGVQTDLQKWFTPHVDLLASHLNHIPTGPGCISSLRPTCLGDGCSEQKLVISHCLFLVRISYPPTFLIHRMIQEYSLVLAPYAVLNRDPTPITSVNNTSQTVPQAITSEPPCLVSW